jgi:hypothetical protein
MPVLFLAVASYLIFFGVLILLWIAGKLEARELRRKSFPWLANPFPQLSIAQAFDPVYSRLWDAPLRALMRVEAAGSPGLPVSRLRPVFRKASARFPEIYEGCSFAQWLQFLEQNRLLACDGRRVTLTADGIAFLRYRFTTDSLLEA